MLEAAWRDMFSDVFFLNLELKRISESRLSTVEFQTVDAEIRKAREIKVSFSHGSRFPR